MPSGKKLYYTKPGEKGSSVWTYDFEEGKEYPVLEDIEELSGTEWSPDEKFLIYTISEKRKPIPDPHCDIWTSWVTVHSLTSPSAASINMM
jgi:hypothetical protein